LIEAAAAGKGSELIVDQANKAEDLTTKHTKNAKVSGSKGGQPTSVIAVSAHAAELLKPRLRGLPVIKP
jgi:hypothetical protein